MGFTKLWFTVLGLGTPLAMKPSTLQPFMLKQKPYINILNPALIGLWLTPGVGRQITHGMRKQCCLRPVQM